MLRLCCLLMFFSSALLGGIAEHNTDSLAPVAQVPDSAFRNHLPPENYQDFTMNGSTFLYDRMLSAYQVWTFHPLAAGDFRWGFHAYQRFFNTAEPVLPLDTHLAHSRIKILLGSEREQALFVDHHQRVAKNAQATIGYHSIVSPGFLLNTLGFHKHFRFGLKHAARRYAVNAGFRYEKVKMDENGGVKPGQVTIGISRSDYEQLQTFLRDDSREIRQFKAFVQQQFLLWQPAQESLKQKKSSLKFLTGTEWTRWSSSYNGTADSLFYPTELLNVSATTDTSAYQQLSADAALQWQWGGDQSHSFRISAGARQSFLSTLMDSLERSLSYITPFLEVEGNMKKLFYSLSLKTVKSSFENNGDVSMVFSMGSQLESSLVSSILLDGGLCKLAPDAIASRFLSNHFEWSNEFQKERSVWLKPQVYLLRNKLKLSHTVMHMVDAVYYGYDATPLQSADAVRVHSTSLVSDIPLRKWRWMARIDYNNVDRGFLRLPEWSIYSRFSYRDFFFKKALFAELGVAVYKQAAYKSYGFMPANGQVFLQAEQFAGGQPVMDVFVNADIGRATITFMMQRVNDGWWGGENYILASYPVPPRTLKFGILWPLFN
jgi:hypothetical protein